MEDGQFSLPVCQDRETSEAVAGAGEAQPGVLSSELAGNPQNHAGVGESKASMNNGGLEAGQLWTAKAPIMLEVFSGRAAHQKFARTGAPGLWDRHYAWTTA